MVQRGSERRGVPTPLGPRGRLAAALVAALLVVAGLGIAACGSSGSVASGGGPGELTSLSVVVNTSASDYIADRKGFFQQNGLKVKISTLADISLVPELVGKQYQIGISTQNLLISAAEHGLKIAAVGADNADSPDNPDYALLVTKSSGITSARDLVGKTIGVPTLNGSLTTALTVWLRNAGVSTKQVHLVMVNFPQMQDQIDSKRIDAAFQVTNFARVMEATGKYTDLGDPMQAVAQKTMGSIRIANTQWAMSHLDILRRYELALHQADQFISQHPAESTQIFVQVGNLPPEVAKFYKNPTYEAVETSDDLAVWLAIMKRQGTVPAHADIDVKSLVVEPLLSSDTCLPFWQLGKCPN